MPSLFNGWVEFFFLCTHRFVGMDNIREMKHRVYLRQTANVNLYHMTNLSIHLSWKIGIFTPILSITIVLSCFYLLISQFWKFLNLNLTFAVCRKRDTQSLYYLIRTPGWGANSWQNCRRTCSLGHDKQRGSTVQLCRRDFCGRSEAQWKLRRTDL